MRLLNSLVVTTLPYVPKKIVFLFARRYIAGDSLDKAVMKCRELNAQNMMTTIDLLGEFIKQPQETIAPTETYLTVLDTIAGNKLNSNVSLKPTSFGASFDPQLSRQNIRKIIEKAFQLHNFVRIDMENHPYTDLTLDMYREFREEFPASVGTVLQAYLKRSYQDADRLSQNTRANLRLCKGIYNEPADIAYKDKEDINKNYLEILELLFSRGAYVGIATHDDPLVEGAQRLISKYKVTRDQYEFQMLLGVRPELRKNLVEQGHRLRVYTPFGKDWYPYSIRRLKENPAIVGSMLQGFLKY